MNQRTKQGKFRVAALISILELLDGDFFVT
jgi:hypothetical protein